MVSLFLTLALHYMHYDTHAVCFVCNDCVQFLDGCIFSCRILVLFCLFICLFHGCFFRETLLSVSFDSLCYLIIRTPDTPTI